LLGVTSSAELERSPFLGARFEGFVAAKILKSQADQGMRKELYYFRDQLGLEVDFLVPRPNSNPWLIEAKVIDGLSPALVASGPGNMVARLIVVHRKSRSQLQTAAIAPGVEALDVERFVQELAALR
jgi:uncharacterized protein